MAKKRRRRKRVTDEEDGKKLGGQVSEWETRLAASKKGAVCPFKYHLMAINGSKYQAGTYLYGNMN